MKSFWIKVLLVVAALILIAGLIFAFHQGHRELVSEAQGEKPEASAPKTETGPNGEAILHVDENAQKLVGLFASNLPAATFPREIKAYGEVLDPAPLITSLSDIASARASLVASSNDFERSKALFDQGQNASAKALETARAARQHDEITLQSARAQLLSAWGKAIVDQPDPVAFVQSLVARKTALIRLDLPSGQVLEQMPVGARLLLPGNVPPMDAQFLDRAATVDRQVQGQGFLLLATNPPVPLTPGLSITGFLQLPGEPFNGVVVPEAAVVRSAETSWVYLQTGSNSFVRREITLNQPADGGWFVTNSVTPGERLVTTGAQMLLSEERKGEIKPAD